MCPPVYCAVQYQEAVSEAICCVGQKPQAVSEAMHCAMQKQEAVTGALCVVQSNIKTLSVEQLASHKLVLWLCTTRPYSHLGLQSSYTTRSLLPALTIRLLHRTTSRSSQ